ncbi:hypothetical protein RM780_07610 [Streptomyces sp. DSM 44917]|uniref:Uncharacterized protein n=1 Tax=Streptomyces boetiae TaxID=3075541 RepID=A0ABU2L5J7_9ACTN|nr:hypothetical protein [Streptomyces sp. DSM 44917]MDT0306828.1 hypothetical protein [Streptomyces sp. DSM 44917]
MHRQSTPVLVTDEFPASVSVVTMRVEGRPYGVVSRTAAADRSRHAEIMRALTRAGIDRQAIREVLDGVRG